MPYKIVERDGKWCVEKRDGSKTFGCHPSKQAARQQVKAIYANTRE